MDTLRENVEDLVSHVGAYVETQKKLIQISAAEKIATMVSGGVSALVTALLGVFVVLFLSLSGGFFLAERLGSSTLGFLLLGGFYLVLLLIFSVSKRALVQAPIANSIYAKFTDDDDKQ